MVTNITTLTLMGKKVGMEELGLRELKTRASEMIRKVRDDRAQDVITHLGRPVALVVPIEEPASGGAADAEEAETLWNELYVLGAEIANNWHSEQSALDYLSEMRR